MDKVKINQCTITLTRKCNLRCNFCYAKKTEYIENDIIDYDDLKKVIDFVMKRELSILFLPEESRRYILKFLTY